jgi:hypothetical protein
MLRPYFVKPLNAPPRWVAVLAVNVESAIVIFPNATASPPALPAVAWLSSNVVSVTVCFAVKPGSDEDPA